MNAKKIILSFLIGIYLICYLTILKFISPEFMPLAKNILSSIGSGIAVGILLVSWKRENLAKKYNIALMLAVIFCFLGNLTMSGIAESSSLGFSNMMYILGNISLAVAIYFLMENSLKKWDGIKIFLDGFILGLMLFYVAWALIYNNIVTYLLFDNFPDSEKLYYLSFLIINFFMLFGLMLFYSFNRNYLKNRVNILEALGYFLWFIANLSFFYLQLYQQFQESYISSLLWTLALIFLAISSSTPKKLEKRSTLEELGLYSNRNLFFNILIGILGIVLFIIAPVTFLVITPILFFRMLISRYIKISRYNVILVENASLDPLTRVFNRKKFIEEFELFLKSSDPVSKAVIIILEINRFKYINSFYGYSIGDKVLIESAERLKKLTEGDNLIGRWNGDEFVFLLKDIDNREMAMSRCQELIECFQIPYSLENNSIICSANIGATMIPEDSVRSDELIMFADSALIRSISLGKNSVVFYEKNLGLEEEYTIL